MESLSFKIDIYTYFYFSSFLIPYLLLDCAYSMDLVSSLTLLEQSKFSFLSLVISSDWAKMIIFFSSMSFAFSSMDFSRILSYLVTSLEIRTEEFLSFLTSSSSF